MNNPWLGASVIVMCLLAMLICWGSEEDYKAGDKDARIVGYLSMALLAAVWALGYASGVTK